MMDRVCLYTYTTVRGPGRKSGSYTYILEYITEKGPATLTVQGELEDVTENQAQLMVLREALERLRRPCELEIYTDSQYLQRGAEEWVRGWRADGWVTARGKPVANREEWERVAGLLEGHLATFRVGEIHSYKRWLQTETEKKEEERKACMTDSENSTARKR
jgi:ribonuclease HI|nr:RNase H family protein [uncultured Acetatifactor sp.]